MWLWIGVGLGSYFLLSVLIALAVGAVVGRVAAVETLWAIERWEIEGEAWAIQPIGAVEDAPMTRDRELEELEEHVAAALDAISWAREEVVAALSALDRSRHAISIADAAQ